MCCSSWAAASGAAIRQGGWFLPGLIILVLGALIAFFLLTQGPGEQTVPVVEPTRAALQPKPWRVCEACWQRPPDFNEQGPEVVR